MPDKRSEFDPDDGFPTPGESLLGVLTDKAITQAELARRMGRPKKTINAIVQGTTEITPETALQLEHVLGEPAFVWLRQQSDHNERVARQAEADRLRGYSDWLEELPLSVLKKRKWVEKKKDDVEQIRAALSFYGVATPDEYYSLLDEQQARMRQSTVHRVDKHAVAAWLRQGERLARQLLHEADDFDAIGFQQVLQSARKLTTEEEPGVFFPKLQRMCFSVGVVVVFVEQVPRSRASGAARWLSPERALIQISDYGKRRDKFWFTFFHEAGHILKHGKRDAFFDIDEEGEGSGDAVKEAEANAFARDTLIPAKEYDLFLAGEVIDVEAISRFASKVGVSAEVVAGRVQHDLAAVDPQIWPRLRRIFGATPDFSALASP